MVTCERTGASVPGRDELSGWIGTAGGYRPMAVPAAAREPLYSTWYAFTQGVSAAKVEDEAERVMAVYSDCAIVRIPDARPTYVVNATGSGSVVLDLARASVWRAYDTFGNAGKTGVAVPGLSRLDVPVSGYLEVTEGPYSPGSRRGKD